MKFGAPLAVGPVTGLLAMELIFMVSWKLFHGGGGGNMVYSVYSHLHSLFLELEFLSWGKIVVFCAFVFLP